jgi:hypothetical protein
MTKIKKKYFLFIIQRTNDLRIFAPIIKKIKKSKKDFIIVNIELKKQNKGNKSYLSIKNNIKIFNKKIIKLDNKKKFHDFIINNSENINHIFALSFVSKERNLISNEFLNLIKDKWIVLNHGFDNWVQIENEYTNYSYNCIFLARSKFDFKRGFAYVKKNGKFKKNVLTNKIKLIFDGMSFYDKETFNLKIKKKNKLLYLPYPFERSRYKNFKGDAFNAVFAGLDVNYYNFFRNYNSFLKSLIKSVKLKILLLLDLCKNILISQKYFRYNEKNIIIKLKKFCIKNNLEFVTKPRIKFPINDILLKNCDRIIYDNEKTYLPTLLQKEIQESKLVVGILTTSFWETALCNTPYINIDIPNFVFSPRQKHFYNSYKNSEFNYKGVVYNIRIQEFINYFDNLELKNFKIYKKPHKKYINKFCGINLNEKRTALEKYLKL